MRYLRLHLCSTGVQTVTCFIALCLVAQLCTILCNPVDCILSGSSVGNLQARKIRASTFMPSSEKDCAVKEDYQVRRNLWMRPIENFGV